MKRKVRRRRQPPGRTEQAWQALRGRVEQTLELPLGSLSALARIELIGNRCVTVEGCRGIVEYTEDCVRLDIGDAILRMTGRELTVRDLTETGAVIYGRLTAIEYL